MMREECGLIPSQQFTRPGEVCGSATVLGAEFMIRAENGKRQRVVVVRKKGGEVRVVQVGQLRNATTSKWVDQRLGNVYRRMLGRCRDTENPNYGGRGIRVCPEWKRSPKRFQQFALAAGWKPGLEIDRIDTDGNYEPANVRFVTRSQNNRNRRNNRVIVIAGQSRTVTEWAELFGIRSRCIWARLAAGEDPAVAVCAPSNRRGDSVADDVTLARMIEDYKARKASGWGKTLGGS